MMCTFVNLIGTPSLAIVRIGSGTRVVFSSIVLERADTLAQYAVVPTSATLSITLALDKALQISENIKFDSNLSRYQFTTWHTLRQGSRGCHILHIPPWHIQYIHKSPWSNTHWGNRAVFRTKSWRLYGIFICKKQIISY